MAMTLKQLVAAFCGRTGLPIPSFCFTNTDSAVVQLVGLVQELPETLMSRYAFQGVVREAVFTTNGTDDLGLITDLTDQGFVRILQDTFFNRTTNLKINYGLSREKWQSQKAMGTQAGPFYECRLRANRLLISPTPPAGETLAFEYQTNALVNVAATGQPAVYWTADDDTFALPDVVAIQWLRFAWKREKGLDYGEDQITFETTLGTMASRDNPKPVIDMGCSPRQLGGVIVQEGNWST